MRFPLRCLVWLCLAERDPSKKSQLARLWSRRHRTRPGSKRAPQCTRAPPCVPRSREHEKDPRPGKSLSTCINRRFIHTHIRCWLCTSASERSEFYTTEQLHPKRSFVVHFQGVYCKVCRRIGIPTQQRLYLYKIKLILGINIRFDTHCCTDAPSSWE